MNIEQAPPGELSPELNAYFQRMWINVERAIGEAQNIIPVREIPDRPIEGVLYYLMFDLDIGNATKGFWIWFNDPELTDGGYWEKLVVGTEID